MEYLYSLTISYDGKLVNAVKSVDLLAIVDAWNKCVDCGDAKEYATYNLSDTSGKMYTKTFYRNGKVEVK